MTKSAKTELRHLIVVLGDQLDGDSAAFDGFDTERDAILQMEVMEEATYIPQHKKRLAYFFAAMRHFRDEQRQRGRTVHYSLLDDRANRGNFRDELAYQAQALKPEKIILLEPGDWRVRHMLDGMDLPIEFREDRHFLCSHADFEEFAADHRRPIMETFYRFMRRRCGILMDAGGEPVGGDWNFDEENRGHFGKHVPTIPKPARFEPDEVTRDVLNLVAMRFKDSPGTLDGFCYPVTRAEARHALDDFVSNRLGLFGRYQDAMRGGEAFLFHSMLSGPLNLHLLNPGEVIEAALDNPADAPLNAVEGFVRQILGWREFVRAIYWQRMPGYAEENALDAHLPVPRFFWTGETEMRCLAEAIGHTIDHAYAHHIERLMVLGLFCLLLGVDPHAVHRWHMSMFWDAVDWVSLPNTLGMSQYGDGGVMGTKPYAAGGNYINKMSDHCRRCRFDPRKSVGEDACPFTTLYWDFIARHARRFQHNPRMKFPYMGLRKKDPDELKQIRRRADALKAQAAG